MKAILTVISLCLLSMASGAQDLKYFKDASGKYGYKDANGVTVISPAYQTAFDFREGLGCVQLDDKWGFIDQTGKKVIALKYDDAQWFSEGLALVNKGATKGEFSWAFGGKYGFIDKSGKEVIPLKFDAASGFKEGLAPVNIGATRGKYGMEGGKYGYIDKSGNEVIPVQYETAGSFSEGLAAITLNGKQGFIDPSGKEVIPFMYERASGFDKGLACVKQDGKYGYIDHSGHPVIPLVYDNADYTFNSGLAYVSKDKKFGFIDKTGKEVIPLVFDDAHSFRQGLASVKTAGKWGFIDTTGNLVIPSIYDYAGYFIDGKADVKLEGKQLSISKADKSIYRQDAVQKEETIFAVREENMPVLTEEQEEAFTGALMDMYFKNDKALFEKANALNEYLKTTMVLKNGDFDKTMWKLSSEEIKKNYCEAARQPLAVYTNDLKNFDPAAKNLDLYMGIKGYLDAVSTFIYTSESWADFIYYPVREYKETDEMLESLDSSIQAMSMGDAFLRGLIPIYQESKKTTGKYLTTMKEQKSKKE